MKRGKIIRKGTAENNSAPTTPAKVTKTRTASATKPSPRKRALYDEGADTLIPKKARTPKKSTTPAATSSLKAEKTEVKEEETIEDDEKV